MKAGTNRSRPGKASSIVSVVFSRGVIATVLLAIAFSAGIPQAFAECKMVQVGELPVRLIQNKLIVDGEINGQKLGVVLDTGLTFTLVKRSAVERLGLRRDRARGVRMFGIGGEIDLESTFVEELKIGQIARKGRRTLVSSENDLGDSVAVFLGEDFLRQVDVEFDLSHGVVRLFEPRDCSVASLAYWADHASAIEIDAVDDARPQIRFTVRINGKPLRALLDSGATVSVLDRPDASLLGVTPETPGVLALGRSAGLGRKAVDYWIGPFQSFAIGDETIRNIAIVFGDVSRNLTYTAGGYAPRRVGGTAAMLLGADFLRSHRVLVANSQRKLYFTYSGGPVFGGAAPSRSESVELEVDANPTAPQK